MVKSLCFSGVMLRITHKKLVLQAKARAYLQNKADMLLLLNFYILRFRRT